MTISKIVPVTFFLIILLLGWRLAAAQSNTKEVQGTISALGKNYIAVTYNTDTAKGIEYEMMLPFDENLKFEHKNNLKDFAAGDTVKVTYEDTTEGEGDKTVTKRKATVISFVSPAPAPLQSGGQ